jgi:hypothetical protein
MFSRRTAPATINASFFPIDSFLFEILLLLGTSSFEHVFHGVVSLVTGILVYRPGRLHQWSFSFPGARKCCRIVDCEFVEDGILVGPREALDQMQVLIGVAEVRLVREIGCVDYECVSLPMTARIAEPLTDIFRDMRTPVQRDDANIVDHLD